MNALETAVVTKQAERIIELNGFIKQLRAAAAMAKEELVFGGDWVTARRQIDKALKLTDGIS
jgi:hypothetical protein